MPKTNAGFIPNLERNEIEEIPPAIPNIPQKAYLERPLTNPFFGPHTAQQSLVSIENSPLARISKTIYQLEIYWTWDFNSQPSFRNWGADSLPVYHMKFILIVWSIPNKVSLKTLQSPSYVCCYRKRGKKYVDKLDNILLIRVRWPPRDK